MTGISNLLNFSSHFGCNIIIVSHFYEAILKANVGLLEICVRLQSAGGDESNLLPANQNVFLIGRVEIHTL